MKVVLQRVNKGSVSVGGKTIGQIKQGLVILLGVGPDDTQDKAQKLAQKLVNLRIFEDDKGKMNLSLIDIEGEALIIPQFTLFADTRRGNRPSFTDAGPPAMAKPLAEYFAECLRKHNIATKEGKFGAHMLVEIHNDGPVTITLEV